MLQLTDFEIISVCLCLMGNINSGRFIVFKGSNDIEGMKVGQSTLILLQGFSQ
jgi:hypothetical protein